MRARSGARRFLPSAGMLLAVSACQEPVPIWVLPNAPDPPGGAPAGGGGAAGTGGPAGACGVAAPAGLAGACGGDGGRGGGAGGPGVRPDPDFGLGGLVTSIPPGRPAQSVDVTGLGVQGAGHVVVAGSVESVPTASEPRDDRDAFVARLFDTGVPDPTFSAATDDPSLTFEGGYLLLDRGNEADRVLSLTVDRAGDRIAWLTNQLQFDLADEEALLWRISFGAAGAAVEAPAVVGLDDVVLLPRLDDGASATHFFSNYGKLPEVCAIEPPAQRTCRPLEDVFTDRGLAASFAFDVDDGPRGADYYWGVTAASGVGVAKLDRDFAPSTAFAAGAGYVLAAPTAASAGASYALTAVAGGPSGLFVAGHTVAPTGARTPFLLKFRRDGAGLDASFGQQGRVVGAAGPDVGWACSVVDGQGALWSAGLDAQGPVVVRWAADGTPEATLRGDAWHFTPARCAFDGAGRLLVAGGGRDDEGRAALKVLRVLAAP